uniref:Zinc finger protein 484 n=1 Tax=Cacopsylla melanoneura TaxID=428564 RepID=A0A8D8Q189_9HEMI
MSRGSKSSTCLLCDASTQSSRNTFAIFTQPVSTSDRKLVQVLSSVLNVDLKENSIHSVVICKKCYKVCNEVDEIQDRLEELKKDLVANYEKTLRKQNEGILEFDEGEDGTLKTGDDNDVFEPHKPTPPPKKKAKAATASKVQKAQQAQQEKTQSRTVVTVKMVDPSSTEKSAPPASTEKTTTRTVVTVKMVDPSDPDSDIQEARPSKLKQSNKMHYVNTKSIAFKEESDDQNFDQYISMGEEDGDYVHNEDEEEEDEDELDDVDRLEEIMEADLKDGELPLKFEVTEEKVTLKRKRGRPRKKAKEDVEVMENLTPEMVIQKLNTDTEKGDDSLTYRCLLCECKENCDPKEIISHVRVAHDIKLYICDMCGKEFLKRSELHVHLDEHMSMQEDGEFQCETCNRIFNSFRLYRVHKRVHFQTVKNYFCELCGKRFTSRSVMEDHFYTHTGTRPHECDTCGKTFVSKYTYKAHLKTHTERDRPYSCVNCGKAFYTQQNLIQHEKTHSGLKEYVCTECGKAFGTARNLEVHLAIHSGNRPFICRLCGKAFARKAEVMDHERTHTGERPYQCEFCGAQFGQRSNLQSHKRATHFDDKRYQCAECDKAFKRRRLLDYHIKATHTGERPYQCDICNASFIYPEHFKKHRRIHTGEKPYFCEVCGKAFNSRDNRNAHRFVHSDKKPYECVVCGAGFMRKPLLYAHMTYQGHETETIVVNQPQLEPSGKTELESFRLDSDGEDKIPMTLIQDPHGNTKLVPLEYKDEDDDVSNLSEGTVGMEQLIINDNGQVELKSGGSIVEISASDLAGADSTGAEAVMSLSEVNGVVQDSTIVQTEDGPVHLVQIRLPDEKGELRETWVNIIPAEESLE